MNKWRKKKFGKQKWVEKDNNYCVDFQHLVDV